MREQAKWLIEPDVFPGECEKLLETLEEMKVPYKTCRFGRPYASYVTEFSDNAVVFYGSFQFAEAVKGAGWRGNFCNFRQFDCSYYYPIFKDYLLNSKYVMIPYGDVERLKDWLVDIFGTEHLFTKPVSGFKEFSGSVKKVGQWNFGYADHDMMGVVAPATNVGREWRLIIAEGNVIGASQYKDGEGENTRSNDVPEQVVGYARAILSRINYNPDPVWMLDVCEHGDCLKVMEVGPFSCCGMYDCDLKNVVGVVNDIVGRV